MQFVLFVKKVFIIMPKKILVVEENALMLEVMSYILINNGYEVFTLSDGNEVFNYIKKNHPDLIILDSKLPGLDGIVIYQLIKMNETTSTLPVIVCSDDESIGEVLHQKGAFDDLLEKPFDIGSLIQKVEYQLAA